MPNQSGIQIWILIHGLGRFFGLMTPPNKGISTIIGNNFVELLQFEEFAVKNVFLFLLFAYFCGKHLELIPNAFFVNVEKKIKTFCRKKKTFSVFQGAPFKPFEHTMIFSAKCIFLFNIDKKINMIPIQDFFKKI